MVESFADFSFWRALGAIIWVNLLLSGDNAVVIALAARSLPKDQQATAVFWGSAAAIALRVLLTVFAVALLQLPWLKLLGGLLLLWVGVKLLVAEGGEGSIDGAQSLLQAIKTILVADLVMSLDNVIAVAAAAEEGPPQARIALLALGLAISIPIVIFGSTMMLGLMERFRVIIISGGALLGYIAGDLMASDPAIRDWVGANASWLVDDKAAAAAGTALVVGLGWWLARRSEALSRRPAEAKQPNS
ncbi:MAG: YjbE family putative metal transport protein [Burkholderiales bacterium]